MRFHEIASGLRLPVSSEEQDILTRVGETGLDVSTMDERGQEVARRMVSRGLLDAQDPKKPSHLSVNSTRNVWRDLW